ncbi:MAG: amidohydrolase family protein [Terracidiphilus sp.]|jgi:imidazolonepropionase-like amidohydrolase
MREDAQIPAATAGRRMWLRVGALINGSGSGASPLRDAHVVYSEAGILYAGADTPPAELVKNGRAQATPDAELPDYTLLPGLIDAHTHMFLEGGELDFDKRAAFLKQSPDELLEQARGRLEKILRIGVTAMRDCGDKDGVGLALSRLCASHARPPIPYIDSPGAAIHHRGRYGSFMAEPLESFATAAECVAARVHAGADRIKIIPTGIINFKQGAVTAAPQMTTEEIAAIVAAAKSHNRQTIAHGSGDEGLEHAIEGGVDSIEHGFFLRDDQLTKMRDRQIAWVPTFSPVQKQVDHADRLGWDAQVVANLQRILDRHAATLLKAHAMGVQVIAGSDAGSCGVAHGFGFLEELELMERAGLSPAAIVHSATGASARRLAFKEKFGEIKPGYLSRFILTRHSPFETVANLRKEKIVVFDDHVSATGESPDVSGL